MADVRAAGRDRYLDTLRALAIVRVVVFHAFPIAALELVFPAMGVMFALGGSLMARSVDRSARRAVRNRVRRLLPALWIMGLILVPLMLRRGWPDHPTWSLLLWVVPVADPPSSEFGHAAAGVLWFLVTYLWLVLLSPLLLRLYRRARIATLLMPLALLGVFLLYPATFGPTAGPVVQNVLAYATCWILGFAHRDGDLARLKPRLIIPLALACTGGALGWAVTHPGGDGVDLTADPLAHTIYGVGFVLALLRWSPDMRWLARVRPLNGFVAMVNHRAVTIYLWHNVAITIAVLLFDPLKLRLLPAQGLEEAVDFGLALVTLGCVVLALGWVEDIAARRKPRMSPFPRKKKIIRVVGPAPVREPVPAG